MKLHHLGEVNDFLYTVDRCEGQVFLEDQDGNQINLKSALSRYVALGALLSDRGPDLDLVCENQADEAKFFVFLSEHPQVGG